MKVTKRSRYVFDAIQEIDSEDVQAEKLRRKRSTSDVAQAKAAQSQLKIYTSLLESRILLQRVITATTTTTATTPEEQNNATTTPVEDIQNECDQILEMLLKARASLMGKELINSKHEDYGRLIQSTNMEDSGEQQLPQVLQSEYDSCHDYWKDVLNRRYKDLRLHSGLTSAKQAQFRVLDSTFWQQVEATVLAQEEPWKHQSSDASAITLFDDSKLYRHMLQDFLSLSSSSSSRGNEEMAAQRLRRSNINNNNNNNNDNNAQKKPVDRKASKGRKIRYATIPKLVNFTFPMTRPSHHQSNTMLDENEWFLSLFGAGTS